MTLSALQQIIRAAKALAEDRRILVLGIPVELIPRLHSNFRSVFGS